MADPPRLPQRIPGALLPVGGYRPRRRPSVRLPDVRWTDDRTAVERLLRKLAEWEP